MRIQTRCSHKPWHDPTPPGIVDCARGWLPPACPVAASCPVASCATLRLPNKVRISNQDKTTDTKQNTAAAGRTSIWHSYARDDVQHSFNARLRFLSTRRGPQQRDVHPAIKANLGGSSWLEPHRDIKRLRECVRTHAHAHTHTHTHKHTHTKVMCTAHSGRPSTSELVTHARSTALI